MKFSNPGKTAVITLILMIIVAGAIVAFFPHDIEISYEGNGKVSPLGEQNVNVLSPIDIEIEPSEGWKVGHIIIDGKETEYNNTGKITFRPNIFGFSSHTIHVEFVESTDRLLTINLIDENNNKVNNRGFTNLETGYYEDESKQILTVEPYDNYVIDNILLDGISVGSSNILEITMDSDHTVDVIFREASDDDIHISVSIDIQVDTNITSAPFGTVSPSGDVKVKYGGSLTIYISLNEGYVLSDVTIDGSSKGPVTSYNITDITESISISIIILDQTPDKDSYTITATAGNGGYITPSGTLTFSKGHTQTFSITPRSGYAISYLTIDGNRTSASSSYTFTNINDDHTIHAVFVRVVYPDYPVTPNPPTPSTPVLQSIEITKEPNKLVYAVGDTLDTAGMEITLHYSNGTHPVIVDGFTYNPDLLDKSGVQVITVSYQGKTDTFEVTVKAKGVGMDVFVTEHNGTPVDNVKLSQYPFTFNDVAPGDIQTVKLTVNDSSELNLNAYVMLHSFSGNITLAEKLTLTVSYTVNNQTKTESAKLSDLWNNSSSDPDPLNLGKIGDGIDILLTINFDTSAGNSLVDKSVRFTLGIYGDPSSGGSP